MSSQLNSKTHFDWGNWPDNYNLMPLDWASGMDRFLQGIAADGVAVSNGIDEDRA